jgi:hypothetical protein
MYSIEAMVTLGLLALFGLILVIGKEQYEKNPEYFKHHRFRDGYVNNWRTWKPNKMPSLHARITNSMPRSKTSKRS